MTTPPTMFRADSDRRTCFESNSRSSLPGMSHEVDRIEGYLSTKGKKNKPDNTAKNTSQLFVTC